MRTIGNTHGGGTAVMRTQGAGAFNHGVFHVAVRGLASALSGALVLGSFWSPSAWAQSAPAGTSKPAPGKAGAAGAKAAPGGAKARPGANPKARVRPAKGKAGMRSATPSGAEGFATEKKSSNVFGLNLLAGYEMNKVNSKGAPSVNGLAYGGLLRYEYRKSSLGFVGGVGGRMFSGSGSTDPGTGAVDLDISMTFATLSGGLFYAMPSLPKLHFYGLGSFDYGVGGKMAFKYGDGQTGPLDSTKLSGLWRATGALQVAYNFVAGLKMGLGANFGTGGFKQADMVATEENPGPFDFTYSNMGVELVTAYDF